MSELDIAGQNLENSIQSFNQALHRLEESLAIAVSEVAELARRTGFEDGKNSAIEQIGSDRNDLIIREELEKSKDREKELTHAIHEAKSALNLSIHEIKSVLGHV